jgi:GT2 family glycosyltransferase
MSLTVCFIVYNEEKHFSVLEENLRNLSKFKKEIQILLIDNCSTDSTPFFLDKIATEYGVLYLRRSLNHMSEARDQAIHCASTEWVGFVDADCLLGIGWADYVLSCLSELKPEVAAIGGPWIPGGRWKSRYLSLFSTFLGNFGLDYLKENRAHFPKSVLHLPTANIIYKRKYVFASGGFSPQYSRVGEDLDMSYRLSNHGYTIEFHPNMSVTHFLPDQWVDWCQKIYFYGKARAEVSWKFKRFSTYICVLPVTFILFLAFNLVLHQSFWLGTLLAYLFVCGFVSARWASLKNVASVFVLMLSTHFFYGLGLTLGFLQIVFSSALSLKKFDQSYNKELETKPLEVARSDFFSGK